MSFGPFFHPDTVVRQPRDPWLDVLLPALAGFPEVALEHMAALEASCPPDKRATLTTVAARTWWALDEDRAATEALERATALGGPEAAALATLVLPEGERWGYARMLVGTPGSRADAACDLAWLALREGDLAAARARVHDALDLCPLHCEAGRWRRFLHHAGDEAPALVANAVDEGESVVARDAFELVPVPECGWVSHVRLARRLCNGAWSRPGPPATARAQLDDLGVITRFFATEEDYLMVGTDHPLVRCEWHADHTLSLDAEGRPAGNAAQALWIAASRVDAPAISDAAQILCALGVRDPSAQRIGLLASATLCEIEPHQPLWQAYRCLIQARTGPSTSCREVALSLVSENGTPDFAWQMAVEALRRMGEDDLARSRVDRAAHDPRRERVATRLLEEWGDPRPFLPIVTDRMRPRFAGVSGPTTTSMLSAGA